MWRYVLALGSSNITTESIGACVLSYFCLGGIFVCANIACVVGAAVSVVIYGWLALVVGLGGW